MGLGLLQKIYPPQRAGRRAGQGNYRHLQHRREPWAGNFPLAQLSKICLLYTSTAYCSSYTLSYALFTNGKYSICNISINLRNEKLSLKAKGLLSMMLSLPEDWNYTTRGLAKKMCIRDSLCMEPPYLSVCGRFPCFLGKYRCPEMSEVWLFPDSLMPVVLSGENNLRKREESKDRLEISL